MNSDEYRDRVERAWSEKLFGTCAGGNRVICGPHKHVTVCGVRGWMQRIDDRAEVEALIASAGGG